MKLENPPDLSASGLFGVSHTRLPAHSVGVWQLQICSFIFLLSSGWPTAPTALFTFVVTADGRRMLPVYEFKPARWKSGAVDSHGKIPSLRKKINMMFLKQTSIGHSIPSYTNN